MGILGLPFTKFQPLETCFSIVRVQTLNQSSLRTREAGDNLATAVIRGVFGSSDYVVATLSPPLQPQCQLLNSRQIPRHVLEEDWQMHIREF